MNSFLDLGREIAKARRGRHLTQADTAQRAGIALSTLARFEAGLATEFGLRKFLAVLDVLGCELRLAPRGHARTLDDVLAERTKQR